MRDAGSTWLDPEERCYPSGSLYAGRRCAALCADGKVRIFRVGLPDTFFSIPARGSKGTKGFITCDDGVYKFNEYRG